MWWPGNTKGAAGHCSSYAESESEEELLTLPSDMVVRHRIAIHVIERQLVNGRYLVGVDIRPGRYRIDDRSTPYGQFVYRTYNAQLECLDDEDGHDAELTIEADLFAFEFQETLRELPNP